MKENRAGSLVNGRVLNIMFKFLWVVSVGALTAYGEEKFVGELGVVEVRTPKKTDRGFFMKACSNNQTIPTIIVEGSDWHRPKWRLLEKDFIKDRTDDTCLVRK